MDRPQRVQRGNVQVAEKNMNHSFRIAGIAAQAVSRGPGHRDE